MNETTHFKNFCKNVLEAQQSQLFLKLLPNLTDFVFGKKSKYMFHRKTVIFLFPQNKKNHIALLISKLNADQFGGNKTKQTNKATHFIPRITSQNLDITKHTCLTPVYQYNGVVYNPVFASVSRIKSLFYIHNSSSEYLH